MEKKAFNLDVMGVSYTVTSSNEIETPGLRGNNGYCDTSTKEIFIDDMRIYDQDAGACKNLSVPQKKTLRHELTHAFLHESGVDTCSWGCNEEIVDWIALQFPKLSAAFQVAESECASCM